jgi:hypothetical protein
MDTVRLVARNWWRILILLVSFAFSIAVARYNFQGGSEHSVIPTVVLLLLLNGLTATGVIQLPPGRNSRPRLSDWIKAVVAFGLTFLWTPIGMRLTPDTPVGITILLIPDAIFMLAALVFVSNGLSRSNDAT